MVQTVSKSLMEAMIWDAASSEQYPLFAMNIEIPTPNKDQVLVKLHAASINNRDVPRSKRTSRQGIPLFVPGSDGAGEIVAFGKDVKGWDVGDRVLIDCFLHDEDEIIGAPTYNGTFAQYIVIEAKNIIRIPSHLSYIEASCLSMALGTAWKALISKGKVKTGETVFIHGIGGGVALFALQIAVSLGANVMVSSGSNEKIEKAMLLGASYGVNYNTENIVEREKEITNGKGADVVIDTIGGNTFSESIKLATRFGRIISIGFHKGELSNVDVKDLVLKELSVLGTVMYNPDELSEALKFVEKTQLKPVVASVYPLSEVVEAYKQIHLSSQFGKVVMQIHP
jgi:zinc-binding alcohol dehydrogenase/oxidoreductase